MTTMNLTENHSVPKGGVIGVELLQAEPIWINAFMDALDVALEVARSTPPLFGIGNEKDAER